MLEDNGRFEVRITRSSGRRPVTLAPYDVVMWIRYEEKEARPALGREPQSSTVI